MPLHESITISQRDGLALRLSAGRAGLLRVELTGGGLVASAEVQADPEGLCAFFKSVATGRVPQWGKWEYKGETDENFVLHASQNLDGKVLLSIGLLATGNDESDWQVNGTILLSLEQFREHAEQVVRCFGPAA